MTMQQDVWRAMAAGVLALAAHGAQAMTDAELAQRLQARFAGDRTGLCVAAAVIDGAQVARAHVCANPRADGGPGDDAAFEIGSVTKTMTAALVADLIQSGRWSLDDPIAKHLPPGTVVPRQGERQILVRDLVTHSSGLPALPAHMRATDPARPYANLSERDVLDSLAEAKLAAPIGTQTAYSNFGMMLVSLAVARTYGQDYETALRERVLAPLGMRGAYITQAPAGIRPAVGHLPSGVATPAWTIATNLAGVGMVRATLADMQRYAQAELGLVDTPLKATLQLTQQPVAHGYGINWMRRNLEGRDLLLHEGGTGGFSSLVVLDPQHGRGVVLLADTALSDMGGLSDIGLALLGLAVPAGTPRLAQPVPASLREQLPGDYLLGALPVTIRAEGERLILAPQGQRPVELHYDDHGTLYVNEASALLLPAIEAGKIDRFTWRQGGGLVEGVRVGSTRSYTATNPRWRDWAGEYDLGSGFRIAVFERDGKLFIQGSGQVAIEASEAGDDRIEVAAVGAQLQFRRDASGKVVGMTLKQRGAVLEGVRK